MTILRNATISILAVFGAALSLLAGDGIWTSEGPAHTAIYSLGLGQAPRTLFAATGYGVQRSTDVGIWTLLAGGGSSANVIAVDPSDPEIIYVGAFEGLLKSTDNGEHFQVLSASGVRALAIDPVQPSTLYAGGGSFGDGSGGTVYTSKDGGANWTALNTRLLVNTIASLVIDPHRNDTLYAGADVWVSTSYYPSPPPPGANNAVIGTQDAGAQWTALLDGSGSNGYFFDTLAVDPQSGTLYAGSGSAVLKAGSSGGWTSASIGLGLGPVGVNALLVDPTSPTTIYAGTSLAGVFRSIDGGSSWVPMSDGLKDDETYPDHRGLWVWSLNLDPVDGVLRAGTENGVFAIRTNATPSPCAAAAEYLCLLGGRYRVSVMAQEQTNYVLDRGLVVQTADRFGSFSFPRFTGDRTLPEVVVKMVEPSSGQGVWIFHGSLTSLPYILTVTDTTTGQIETYTNASQNRLCGGADTAAFSKGGPALGAEASAAKSLAVAPRNEQTVGQSLSLLDDRFSVTLSAAGEGRTVQGVSVQGTDRYGYFSLPSFTGDASFPEVVVKMIDATALNGRFWFFYTGLTNLDYTLTVKDSVTGATKNYASAVPFCGGADTDAFSN